MTNEENPLDYFKNLTCEPHDAVISLEDMEKTIKFHEDELAEEDKRVEGTDEYPNYGDDFADMVYIARRLLDHVKTQKQEIEQLHKEGFHLAANQCHAGYAGEYGHHRCAEIDRLTEERDEARRAYCEEAFAHRFNERRFNERGAMGPITDPQQIAYMMKWDCYKENTND